MAESQASRGDRTGVEFVLSYTHQHWCAKSEGIVLMAENLRALEEAVAVTLVERFGEDRPVQAQMRFDTNGIPRWIRQYQAHYFNYVLNIGAARNYE